MALSACGDGSRRGGPGALRAPSYCCQRRVRSCCALVLWKWQRCSVALSVLQRWGLVGWSSSIEEHVQLVM